MISRIVAGTLGAALLLSAACAAGREIKLSAEQIRSLGVQTEPLAPGSAAAIEGLPAQVAVPNAQMRVVAAPLAALVERILVSSQEAVTKGQLVAVLQSPALADLQHTFLQAATQLALARANLDRDEELSPHGIIAESRLLATRSHYAEVRADVAERTQALRLAGMPDAAIERLRRGQGVGSAIELRAPIDGVVLEQLALAGQRIEAASPVLRIARLDPLWLEIQVPVARLAAVRVGAAVDVPALGATGSVLAIGRSVAANQTVLVRAQMTRGVERLRPGQFVEAAIAAAQESSRWSVPNAALARVRGEALLFVRSLAGFDARPVKVLSEGAERSVVAGELRAGEQVAVKGVSALKAAAAAAEQ